MQLQGQSLERTGGPLFGEKNEMDLRVMDREELLIEEFEPEMLRFSKAL